MKPSSSFLSPFVIVSLFFFFSGSARGRWYKFNDTVVEEFDMNDETLEYECFGGEYRPKVYDQCKRRRRLETWTCKYWLWFDEGRDQCVCSQPVS